MSQKIEYTYDTNNNLTYQTEIYPDNQTWENYFQVEYIYDANNNLTDEIGSYWIDAQWVAEYKDVRTYDAKGNEITCISHESPDGSTWNQSHQFSYTVDSLDNVLTIFSSYWNNPLSRWEAVNKEEYVLDYTTLRANLIVPEEEYYHSVKVLQRIYTEFDPSPESETSVYYYSGQASVMSCPIGERSLSVYPNPVNNKLTVSAASGSEIISLEVIDLTGRRLTGVENANCIDVSMLSSGIYLLKINTEKESVCKKIIKQ